MNHRLTILTPDTGRKSTVCENMEIVHQKLTEFIKSTDELSYIIEVDLNI